MRTLLLAKLAALPSLLESPFFMFLAPLVTVLACAIGALLLSALVAVLPPAASAADASDFQRPAMFFQQMGPYFCFENRGRLSLFGCDDDVSVDPFLLSQPVERASAQLFPIRRPQAHVASRFANLAGKFMGRVDAATVGSFRFRFVVILE